MNLLPKKQVRDSVKEQDGAFSIRSSELINAVALMERRLNTLKNDYERELLEGKERLATELADLEASRNALGAEVNALEERRRDALKPVKEEAALVTEKLRIANDLLESVKKREELCDVREADIEDRIENITNRLDDITGMEERADKDREKASSLKSAAELLYKSVHDSEIETSARLKAERDSLDIGKATLAKERAKLDASHRHLDDLREAIAKEQAKVDDDRAKLKSAITVAESKYGITR